MVDCIFVFGSRFELQFKFSLKILLLTIFFKVLLIIGFSYLFNSQFFRNIVNYNFWFLLFRPFYFHAFLKFFISILSVSFLPSVSIIIVFLVVLIYIILILSSHGFSIFLIFFSVFLVTPPFPSV